MALQVMTARDFRVRPGAVWRTLKRTGRLMVTSRGRPLALVTDIEGRDVEEELQAANLARLTLAVSRLREQARRSGANRMTMQEIDREIRAVRRKR